MVKITHRIRVEAEEKWREIVRDMPYLSFPDGYMIKVIPPFAGATARFLVGRKDKDKVVSVYCDHYNQLGFMDGPYWEALLGDDMVRFMLNEENKLVSSICNYLESK